MPEQYVITVTDEERDVIFTDIGINRSFMLRGDHPLAEEFDRWSANVLLTAVVQEHGTAVAQEIVDTVAAEEGIDPTEVAVVNADQYNADPTQN